MSDKLNTQFIKISNPAWGPVGARMCVGSEWRLASGKKMPKHERLNLKIKGLSFKSEKEKLNVRMCACLYPSQLLHPWEKDKGLTSDTRKSKQSCAHTHSQQSYLEAQLLLPVATASYIDFHPEELRRRYGEEKKCEREKLLIGMQWIKWTTYNAVPVDKRNLT